MSLAGKVAVVTGAARGIGKAVAAHLASEGATVVIADINGKAAGETAAELEAAGRTAMGCPLDVTSPAQVAAMVEAVLARYGRIDILINNAGQGYDAPVEKINIRTFRHIFELDLVGPLIAMQQVIPIMREQKGGSIINVSSGTALMTLPNMGPYSSLKGALASLSLTAREELLAEGICISVIYPYITLTDFEENTIKAVEEGPWEGDGDDTFFPPDTAEFVAEKIFEGIRSGEAEIFTHDWMKKSG